MPNIITKILYKYLLNKEFWAGLWHNKFFVKQSARFVKQLVGFFFLIIIFLVEQFIVIIKLTPLKIIFRILQPSWQAQINQRTYGLIDRIDHLASGGSEVKRFYLIGLAFRNMSLRKVRSFVTIGGMALGIAAIVFLVSLGYGLERVVIGRVAGLDELKMADINIGENTALRLDDALLKKIGQLSKTKEVIPMISVVGRVAYKNSYTDILAYAVPRQYLDKARIVPVSGKLFDDSNIYLSESDVQVQGASTQRLPGYLGSEINGQELFFNVLPEKLVAVRSRPDIKEEVIGFTKRVEGTLIGKEYWGGRYFSLDDSGESGVDEKGEVLGRWIQAKVPLYEETGEGKVVPSLDELGFPVWETGYLIERDLQVVGRKEIFGQTQEGSVLGVSESSPSATDSQNSEDEIVASESAIAVVEAGTASAEFASSATSTDSAGIEWVELKSTPSAALSQDKLDFKQSPSGKAIISSAMLKIFNLKPAEAVGNKFSVSFIVVKSLMPEINGRMMTDEVEYEIIGVVDDNVSAYFYVPFIDLRKAGVSNFSQARFVVARKEDLAGVRHEIETFGYRTTSTADTVAQIESFFATARLLLGFLGIVALAVAVLGMFNTLTVSLLERTREIGGMKAMGMLSIDVRDLLLAEAMIMGICGGLFGLFLGFVAGKLLSIIVSLLSLVQGQGIIDMAYVPPGFVVFIIITSFVVGVITGIYPAKRATKISALDALRYE